MDYSELFARARDEIGVPLKIVGVGGGNDAIHGRLDSGHWLVITDADDFLSDAAARCESEQDGYPLGWFVGVYENDSASYGVDYPASHAEGGCLAYAQDDDATIGDLPRVIREALGELSEHVRHCCGAGR